MDKSRAREVFLASIDRAFDSFGTTVGAVVYFEMKKSYGISREDIPRNPEAFMKTIEKIFGIGAEVVEKAVRRELERSSGVVDLSKKDLLVAMRTAYHKHLED